MMRYVCSDRAKLCYKRLSIVVTNACNLSCGGCHQLCGLFSKKQLWFITPKDFELCVGACIHWANEFWERPDFQDHDKNIGVYGGEPLIHPQWRELSAIMKSHPKYKFLVYTNGCKSKKKRPITTVTYLSYVPEICRQHTGPALPIPSCRCGYLEPTYCGLGDMFEVGHDMSHSQTGNVIYKCPKCDTYIEVRITPPEVYRSEQDENIQYLVSEKAKDSLRVFVPPLVAPVDFESKPQSKEQYWVLAKKNCYIWNHCESAIYNKRGYFCVVAAALDHMYNEGRYGWEIDPDRNPMDRSDDEIREQASQFCYRCGFCTGDRHGVDRIVGHKQLACEKTVCSATNANGLPTQAVEII